MILMVMTALLLVACGGERMREPNIQGELVLEGIDDTHWTYFSFESGSVVGQSDWMDAEGDALWAARDDWDIAICGNYIRTNSGTSGKGMGGIQLNTENAFLSLKQAPADGYLVDSLYVAK